MPAPPGTRALVLIADYIAVDPVGKINAVGAGITFIPMQPSGSISPIYVAAVIDMPAKSAGDQAAVTIELRDESSDSLVTVPDPQGQPGALRVQQLLPVQKLQVPGVALPPELACRVQTVLGFPGGIALTPGRRYAWKLEIDGTRLKGWSAHFYVPAPPTPPVVGGPFGAADIPNVLPPSVEEDDEAE